MKTKINIALLDDHSLFRQGMVSLLRTYSDLDVLIETSNEENIFNQSPWESIHVLLLEIEMPAMSRIETMILLKKKYPMLRIIVLTSYNDSELIFQLTELGADAFIPKGKNIEHVVDVIRNLHNDGYYYSEETSKALVMGIQNRNKQTKLIKTITLSDREIEVLKLLCEQHTNREIAEILKLSPRTIDTYRENLFIKTGAKNIVGIVRYAISNHLID
jgi:DNA-binding NarL/FixJ family response regulator